MNAIAKGRVVVDKAFRGKWPKGRRVVATAYYRRNFPNSAVTGVVAGYGRGINLIRVRVGDASEPTTFHVVHWRLAHPVRG